jgi:predicted ribosome quality control (RQC) complex YloA/Tae2 family protein
LDFMSLSLQELAAVIGELQVLRGAAVQKAYVPRERLLVLELRQPGTTQLLLISAEPGLTRIHLASGRPPSPEEALPFQQMVRAHLVGRRLTGIVQRGGDRVVELRFANEEGGRALVGELTGRHGNLFLTSESGVILSLAARNLSHDRNLGVGQVYTPPAGVPTLPASHAEPAKIGSRRFDASGQTLSAQIEAAYASRESTLTEGELRRRLQRPLLSKKARLERTLAKVRLEADRTSEASVHLVAGELLKQNLHRITRGQSSALLTDYSTGEPREVEVPLRPELPPSENLERHFRQYRRLSQGSVRAAERLAQLERELAEINRRLEEAASGDVSQLPLPQEASPTVGGEKHRTTTHRPFKELLGWSGKRIWVGKSAADNDRLTFKQARGHDLWLHVRGPRGAHVVVPLDRGQPIAQELLLDAVAAAVHFSEAKDEPLVEVVYVPVQRVRRVKGGAPGAVTYSQEKTLRYRVEPERIARLLQSQLEG